MSADDVHPPPLNAPIPKTGGFSPMLLSAAVYPGTGQLMQRRWVAGILFVVSSTGVLGWFLLKVIVILKAYYGLAFDPANVPAEPPHAGAMLMPLLVWILIYLAGLVDTVMGTYRKRVTRLRMRV
ncbi:MAG: hypothetical protein WCO42_02490 [bacterium]